MTIQCDDKCWNLFAYGALLLSLLSMVGMILKLSVDICMGLLTAGGVSVDAGAL
jgi:hypothetical protein